MIFLSRRTLLTFNSLKKKKERKKEYGLRIMKGNGGTRVKSNERVRGVSRLTLRPDLTHTLSHRQALEQSWHTLRRNDAFWWVLVCVSYASTGIDVSDDYAFKHHSSSLEGGNRRGHVVIVGSYRSTKSIPRRSVDFVVSRMFFSEFIRNAYYRS